MRVWRADKIKFTADAIQFIAAHSKQVRVWRADKIELTADAL